MGKTNRNRKHEDAFHKRMQKQLRNRKKNVEYTYENLDTPEEDTTEELDDLEVEYGLDE